MEEYIFDGEIHAISEEFAYILKRIDSTPDKKIKSQIRELTEEFYRKYAEYLFQNDKEKVIEYLMNVFINMFLFDQSPEGVSIIYRPPEVASFLSQYATLAMKFTRAKEDNLVKKDESVRKSVSNRPRKRKGSSKGKTPID